MLYYNNILYIMYNHYVRVDTNLGTYASQPMFTANMFAHMCSYVTQKYHKIPRFNMKIHCSPPRCILTCPPSHENLQRPLGQSTNGVKAAWGCQCPNRESPCSLSNHC